MASAGTDSDSDDLVTIICTEPDGVASDQNSDIIDEIVLSTISSDLSSILKQKPLKFNVNPNRLIEESSYFRGLLSGKFSEARLDALSIQWDVESFVTVLQFIFGCQVEISSHNFIPLNEAALFFGVEALLSKCQIWLEEVTAFRGLQSPILCLDDLISVWKYGFEHDVGFVV